MLSEEERAERRKRMNELEEERFRNGEGRRLRRDEVLPEKKEDIASWSMSHGYYSCGIWSLVNGWYAVGVAHYDGSAVLLFDKAKDAKAYFVNEVKQNLHM